MYSLGMYLGTNSSCVKYNHSLSAAIHRDYHKYLPRVGPGYLGMSDVLRHNGPDQTEFK